MKRISSGACSFASAFKNSNIVIGDQAAFYLNGKVNTPIVRQYTPKGRASDFNYNLTDSRQKITV